MSRYDLIQHVRGESYFVDDLIIPEGTLYASIFYSPKAHGKILRLNLEEIKSLSGVKGIFTSDDIPGENQIGGIIPDEELLAKDEVTFIGQPIAIIVAESQTTAKLAREKIKIEIEDLPLIIDPREAFAKGELIIPPRMFSLGDVESAWKNCDIVVSGKAETSGQEHIYLETQGAIAMPTEGGGVKIYSSTQGPTVVQRTVARVLGLSMNKIEVDVPRLGGGFGGKEDQANAWAAMAALASFKLKKPVKLVLPRQEDIKVTGKRHPYSADFKIGLTNEGNILAYEVTFYQNAGASADLSPAILDRTLFHSTNSYFIPNVKATGFCCRTNLPPNTAFRGFGGPQAMFVMEAAIYKAAEKMGIDPFIIQRKNLLNEGDEFPYGQKIKSSNARRCWTELDEKYQLTEIKNKIERFNNSNILSKKGFAVMPVCFGISFTNTFMNQASALVHIYSDGSVGITTAAIEMGQGVNEKLRKIAANIFSININKVKIESSNTTRIANASPTAASSSADLNGKALEVACNSLRDRLTGSIRQELKIENNISVHIKDELVYIIDKPTELKWEDVIKSAFMKRVNLSSQSQYATPGISFDKGTSKGNPFAYYSFGTAVLEVTLDCLRGIYKIDSIKVLHDFGKSLDKVIDKGQAEGAIVQGLGWMTIEDVVYNDQGKLLTDSLSTYKIPDVHFAPENIEINFLENSINPMGIFNSKAIGEPPLMYGIGVYFALINAMKAFRPNNIFPIAAPLTPEKVLLSLYSNLNEPISSNIS
ncbi:MAG: molybdopterin-dependent oxidoreductase [Bacteroidetes bacterium]|nr:molybdopterin-dependent oxidoreductase [Bacteroidota bacterium]